MNATAPLSGALADLAAAKDIEAARMALSKLGDPMQAILKVFGVVNFAPVHVIHCPMAFDGKGAFWVQRTNDVRNPYFGKSMLTCGDVVEQSGTAHPTTEGVDQHD